MLILTIGVWIGPKSSLLLLIDLGLAILNRLDGVEKFNTKQPNYVDGNWAPTHQELDQIKMTGNGFIPENLIGKEVYIMPRCVSKKRPSRLRYYSIMCHRFGPNSGIFTTNLYR